MSKITKIVLDKQSDLILTNATLTTPQGLVKSDVSGLVTDLANLVTADSTEAAARIAGDTALSASLATEVAARIADVDAEEAANDADWNVEKFI